MTRHTDRGLRLVAVCVAVCGSVRCSMLQCALQYVAVCIAACCSVIPCNAACGSVL